MKSIAQPQVEEVPVKVPEEPLITRLWMVRRVEMRESTGSGLKMVLR